MKEKYIEERFSRYFFFGVHPLTHRVDVCSVDREIATVDKCDGVIIISERDKAVNFIRDMANAFEAADKEAFNKFWYG